MTSSSFWPRRVTNSSQTQTQKCLPNWCIICGRNILTTRSASWSNRPYNRWRAPSPSPSSQSISLASALPRAEVPHSWWPSRPRRVWLEITFPFCMAKVSLTVTNPTGDCSLHSPPFCHLSFYVHKLLLCMCFLSLFYVFHFQISLSLTLFLWLPPLALCNPKTTSRSSPPPIKVVNQSNLFLSPSFSGCG